MDTPPQPPRSGLDRLGRPLTDLRVSVTDRCNFRCPHCMPREAFRGHRFLPRRQILSFEEISRLVRIFRSLGVEKVRLTGGEPLLRRDLAVLIGQLADPPGLDLALTTNGSLLAEQARDLAAAGLRRVTVSLDALDATTFERMSDSRVPVERVLAGIEAADAAGLRPLKINAVIRAGINEHAVEQLLERFRGSGHVVRFIEYMDVGSTNGWRLDEVVTMEEMRRRIEARWPLEPLPPARPGETARRYRFRDGGGEVGFIASVSRPFCGDCTRARLSAEGRLFTCLFATTGTDLKTPLREGATDDELRELIGGVWRRRTDRYSELRTAESAAPEPRVEMSYIGG